MKTFALLLGLLALASSAYGDARSITIELSRDKHKQTFVSIVGSVPSENRQNTSVEDALTVLRKASSPKGTVLAVVHSNEFIPAADLKVLLDAISTNHYIELDYVQVGQRPNWYKGPSQQTP